MIQLQMENCTNIDCLVMNNQLQVQQEGQSELILCRYRNTRSIQIQNYLQYCVICVLLLIIGGLKVDDNNNILTSVESFSIPTTIGIRSSNIGNRIIQNTMTVNTKNSNVYSHKLNPIPTALGSVSVNSASDNDNDDDDPNTIIQQLLSAKENENGIGLGKAVSYLQQVIRKQQQHNNNNNNVQLSRETWDLIFQTIEERTASAEENTENLREIQNNAIFPLQSMARQEMTDMYSCLYKLGQLKLYGAASTVDTEIGTTNNIVSNDIVNTNYKKLPAIGSYTVPPTLLEEILNMPMTALTPQPTNNLLWSGAAFAILEGIISLTTGLSFDLLVIATIVFVIVDKLFVNGAIIESIYKFFSPTIQQKINRHEAGHFLLAYILGCPVEGIVLSPWAALQDRRFNGRTVTAGTSFFDPDLSQQMNTLVQQQPKVTRSSIDRYSIIVMGGIAAEANHYGRADGGAGDEMALVTFLSQLSSSSSSRTSKNNKNGSGGTWNIETIRNQARWGALQAVLLLRYYKPCYDALVNALECGGSLGDCIYSIEKAARDYNLQPLINPVGYIIDNPQTNIVQWRAAVNSTTIPTTTLSSDKQNGNSIGETTSIFNSIEQPVQTQQQQQHQPVSSLAKEFDPEEATKSLHEYRAEVERKLQEVESKLRELK